MDDITKYGSLGWDFDMTLCGHPRSPDFWAYIHENPYVQTHYIVTFRTGRLFDRIWYDLARAGCTLLQMQFHGVFGIPDALYESFVSGTKEGAAYLYWKGEICHRYGIECLIDDATLEVWGGCSRFDIDYIHPELAAF